MLDEELVRLNYSRMPDGQLIRTVQKEGMELDRKALAIIKEEFLKRKLDTSPFDELAQRQELLRLEQIERDKVAFEENNAKTIWKYVMGELENSASFSQIASGLRDRGIEEEDCNAVVREIPSHIRETITSKDAQMVGGALVFLVGAVITLFTFANASMNGGGYYYIAYGAVLAGPATFFKSRSDKRKLKRMQQHIEAAQAFGIDAAD